MPQSRETFTPVRPSSRYSISLRSGCRPMASFTIERGKRRIAPRVSYLSLLRTTRLRQKPLPDRASTARSVHRNAAGRAREKTQRMFILDTKSSANRRVPADGHWRATAKCGARCRSTRGAGDQQYRAGAALRRARSGDCRGHRDVLLARGLRRCARARERAQDRRPIPARKVPFASLGVGLAGSAAGKLDGAVLFKLLLGLLGCEQRGPKKPEDKGRNGQKGDGGANFAEM